MFLDLDDVWAKREGKWVLMNGPEKFLAALDNINMTSEKPKKNLVTL